MAIPRKKTNQPINIAAMYSIAKADVAYYYDIIDQIQELIQSHPEVSHTFIVEQILKKHAQTEKWFMEMQGYHKEAIIDQIKPRRKD